MSQPETQLPALQTWFVGQLAAPVAFVHVDVLEDGVQISHPLFAVVPALTNDPPIQHPDTQLAGLPLQTSPVGQLALSPSVLVHDDVLVPGWQLSHGSLAFTAPEATIPVPAMSHSEPHAPFLQASPPPQVVPGGAFVHTVVLDEGVQISQPLFAVVVGE
jgi:hypothetical protein